MEHKDSSSALSLLQYGDDDSEEESSFNEQDGPIPEGIKSPKDRKRRTSGRGSESFSPSRHVSEDSVGKHVGALISDEEGDHHDDHENDRKREHEVDDEGEEAVPSKMTMIDISKKMAPSVSPYNENSPSSFDDRSSTTSQKKSSKPVTQLVSYERDEHEEEEEEAGSSDESQNEEIEEENEQNNGETMDSSPGARGFMGMDSNNLQLPPEPTGKCPKDIQDKITDLYMQMRQQGFDTNNEIQRLTSFRNPSIYEKLIQMHHIDEKGSNFPLEVYNPHMWGKESFYDELDKAQKKDMERREKERKTKIEFISGTKKSAQASQSDTSGTAADDKKRKSKWDVGVPQPQRGTSSSAPNLTTSATGTRATIISAVGTLTKKATFSIINTSGPTK